MSNDETRLSADSVTVGPSGQPTAASGPRSGWLTSSGGIDHGRFGPGTILEERYRVIGLLGRGGMGEVYRADDLRLGQPVALKFLPADLARDPLRLAQLHNEVRTARHVSHPNVCRVYDIGELRGELFITMEYVDGEDLSVLLRRIGRLPEDKGIEIARQVCAGLAAAHERGVLHRDLKPANIMLDGAGKVRVMDFSLAAAGEVTDVRAGTPAYMAPEQLGGQTVTIRSDIYALGLVLYEIFTGRRTFDAQSLTDLVAQHQSGDIVAPTTIVKTLDPAIEKAIMRCLETEPSRRPASALRVSALLPGGDPLAEAIAAGETPSPEMVAAAGGDRAALGAVAGVAWLAAAVLLVATFAWASGRVALLARVPLDKPAAVLEDRAEQMRQAFGYTDRARDRARGFTQDNAFLQWVPRNRPGQQRWSILESGRPAALRFWYRTSPEPIIPMDQAGSTTLTDPPVTINGMTLVIVDTMGRLQRFEAAPPHVEPPLSAPAPLVDWSKAFAASGLDQATFAAATPSRTPPAYADERKAWTGTLPGTDIPVTIDAAGYRGRAIQWDIVPPWRAPAREPRGDVNPGTNPIYIYLLLGGAAIAAALNLRRGRADRRGASRFATFMFCLLSVSWLVGPHVANRAVEQQRLFANVGNALFVAGVLYLLYLGLEPSVRRSWPTMLIGWSRLLAGGVGDPIVGRDVLVGVVAGAALAVLNVATSMLPVKLGQAEPTPFTNSLGPLMGARGYLGTLVVGVNIGLQNAFITVFQIAIFKVIFERVTRSGLHWTSRRWSGRLSMSAATSERVFFITTVLGTVLVSMLDYAGDGRALTVALYPAVGMTLSLLVLLRLGIFAAAVMYVVNILLLRMPLTLDTSALYASASWATISGAILLAATGFWIARRDAAEA